MIPQTAQSGPSTGRAAPPVTDPLYSAHPRASAAYSRSEPLDNRDSSAGDMSQDAGRPEVLLVEDSADDAELSLRVLSRSGIAPNAKWVRDGAEAIDWLVAGGLQSLKLILLDLKMPRMDGYEVLRRLKCDPGMRSVPIIVMVSAHGTPELARCFALGADSYLVKPLEADALRDAARSLDLHLG